MDNYRRVDTEPHEMDVKVSTRDFQRSHSLPEITLNGLLQEVWATKPFERCKCCDRQVFTTDGMCYPCFLMESEEFQQHMTEWGVMYGTSTPRILQ
jgi:hypothetical protein